MALTNAKIRKALEAKAEREIASGKISDRTQRFLENRLHGNGPRESASKTKPIDPNKVTSKLALRTALEVDNKTFYTYLAKPGAPKPREGKWIVSEFREHMARCGYNPQGKQAIPEPVEGKPVELPPHDPRVLRAEAARMKIAREQRELDILDREYVSRSEVNESIARCNAIVKRDLEKALGHELPPLLEGMTAAEMSEKIMAKLGEVLANLPDSLRGKE